MKLTKKDYYAILSFTRRYYIEDSTSDLQNDLFVCKCYVKAILDYFHSKDYRLVKSEDIIE